MNRPTKDQVDVALQSLQWDDLAPPLVAIAAQAVAAELKALQHDFTVISTKCGELMADLAVAKEAIDILIEERDLAQANSEDREKLMADLAVAKEELELACKAVDSWKEEARHQAREIKYQYDTIAQLKQLPEQWRCAAASVNDPKSPSIYIECATDVDNILPAVDEDE